MALVLGVAFGPQATHVEVRQSDTGALVATGAARHIDLGPEADDPTAWWRSLVSAVAQSGQREIAAISVCGSHPGLVLLDGAGAVLRPMQPWSQAETSGAEAPGSMVARLKWLRRADPQTFKRIGAALLPHDWLTYRLTGRVVTDRGGASLTGAWSPANEDWMRRALADLAPDGSFEWWHGRLPAVLAPSERADWLDAPVYDLLGLRGRPLVGPGTGEPMAVALALGVAPGRPATALGIATRVLAGLDRPIDDPNGLARSCADATGRHLAIAETAGGAAIVDVVRTLLDADAPELGALTSESSPGAGGLVLVPDVPGRLGGVLTGVTAGVTRGDLARAAFDGVACDALDTLDLLIDAGAAWDDDEPLRVSAPAPELQVHAQCIADLSGRPVRPVSGVSLAAAGACAQAAAVLLELPPDEVAAEWDLGGDVWVEPADEPPGGPTRAERRQAHAEERARQRRALIKRR